MIPSQCGEIGTSRQIPHKQAEIKPWYIVTEVLYPSITNISREQHSSCLNTTVPRKHSRKRTEKVYRAHLKSLQRTVDVVTQIIKNCTKSLRLGTDKKADQYKNWHSYIESAPGNYTFLAWQDPVPFSLTWRKKKPFKSKWTHAWKAPLISC